MTRRARPRPEATSDPSSIDRAQLENWALSYLGRYASSAENLRRVLQRRVRRRLPQDNDRAALNAADAEIVALVERYGAAGLVDDAAYAAARARSEAARGRPLRRIAAALAGKGIGAEEIDGAIGALREAAGDPDLAAAAAFARRRHLGPYRRAPAERRRELAAFARAGFARRVAEAIIACPDEAALASLLSQDAAGG